LRGRLYLSHRKPCQVRVLTRWNCITNARYPVAEAYFQQPHIQPYIHDCHVTVREHRNTYRYCVFFKNHRHLRVNQFLLKGDGHAELKFRGDAVVMRVGTRTGFVNMRERDTAISDWAMERFVVCLRLSYLFDKSQGSTYTSKAAPPTSPTSISSQTVVHRNSPIVLFVIKKVSHYYALCFVFLRIPHLSSRASPLCLLAHPLCCFGGAPLSMCCSLRSHC
jgi:hypothetical protein